MATLRNARDTFLRYLADNTGLTIHNQRFDKLDPKLNELRLNAVNVAFHNNDLVGPSELSALLVTVDVVNENEIAAGEQAATISRLLFTAAYAPLMDYTVPSAPTQIENERMFWNLDIKFRPVHADNFFRLSALLRLSVHFS